MSPSRVAINELIELVLRRPPRLGPVRAIAIDGPSGAGKTQFARALKDQLQEQRGTSTAIVPCDAFATWDNPVAWWPTLEATVLEPLASGRPGSYQALEWINGVPRPGPWYAVPVVDFLILEGVSSARRSIAARLTASAWIGWGDDQARLEAAVNRDGEDSRAHLQRWQRFEHGWFPIDGAQHRADIRVTG
ncbi:uridine kinase [Hoyosella sp. G463]|uniref:Uridine kinase n=1 Tax=Lolliginicoccus lacisalsi TaxID=2742202 RepID=A0A927PN38_9ACTN|nr:uridine kinase [Lolliginicoccus lacisalsi]MBD8507201.1 uridine kinase [Lolliginicoccus lacisalsi]